MSVSVVFPKQKRDRKKEIKKKKEKKRGNFFWRHLFNNLTTRSQTQACQVPQLQQNQTRARTTTNRKIILPASMPHGRNEKVEANLVDGVIRNEQGEIVKRFLQSKWDPCPVQELQHFRFQSSQNKASSLETGTIGNRRRSRPQSRS